MQKIIKDQGRVKFFSEKEKRQEQYDFLVKYSFCNYTLIKNR